MSLKQFPFILVISICLSQENLRNFLYRAHSRGMTTPDYVYLYYTYLLESFEETPWIHLNEEMPSTEELQLRKKAFMALKTVSVY